MVSGKQSDYLSRTDHRKKRKRRWLVSLAVLIILTLVAVTGYGSFKIQNFFDKISNSSQSNNGGNTDEDSEAVKLKSSFAILLLGEDYREETGSKNTDAIILSIWNPEVKEVTLLSIPRDTKMKIPDHGNGKINSLFSKAGPEGTLETLSEYFNIPVEYYAKIDFRAFEEIIDELGGVQIDVERDMNYHSDADGTDIHLTKGLQVLNGKQALDYARFRKSSDGNDSNDFERNQRHQKIIEAFSHEVTSIKGIMNIFDLLEVSGEHISTNLSPNQMKSIFFTFNGLRSDDIHSLEMDSYWKSPYVYVEEEEQIRVQNELSREFNKKEKDPVKPKEIPEEDA